MIYSAYFPDRNMSKKIDVWLGWIQYTWYIQLRPIVLKVLAIVFTVCALIVIFAELTFYFNPNQNYLADIFENYALNPNAKSYFMANLVCLIPLGYICAAANFGMFNFKLFSLYQLHNHQQTEPSHLLWSALLLTRLSYGVAYNFLELVNIKTCAFFDVMGPISQVDFLG
jgi:hypothetical protein